jgi:hypothetical protein
MVVRSISDLHSVWRGGYGTYDGIALQCSYRHGFEDRTTWRLRLYRLSRINEAGPDWPCMKILGGFFPFAISRKFF